MQFGPQTVSLMWSAFRVIFTVCLSSWRTHRILANQIHFWGVSQRFQSLRFFVRFRGPLFRHKLCTSGVCQTVFQGESSNGWLQSCWRPGFEADTATVRHRTKFPIRLGSLYLITENSVSQCCSLLEDDSPYLTIRSDIDRSIWWRVWGVQEDRGRC